MVEGSVQRPGNRSKLYLAVITVNLLFVSTGCVLTWPSPVLPELKLAIDRGAWISSVSALGGALGPIANSLLSRITGRKTLLIVNGITFLVSWTVLLFWQDYAGMILGRIVGGLAVGFSFISVPAYLTEVADDEMRQAATSLTELFIGVGYLVVYGLGPRLSYFYLQLSCFIPAVVFVIAVVMMPETPYYLIMSGDLTAAARSLAWFRGLPTDRVGTELQHIQESLEKEGQAEAGSKGGNLDAIRNRGYRKALLLGLTVLFIQQMSGICVVTSFTEPILEASQPPIAASTGALLFGVVNLFSSALAPPLVAKFGTKRVLVSCDIIMALSLYSYGVYMYCLMKGLDVTPYNSLPVVALILYNVFFCIGGGPLPWSLIAELSCSRLRAFNSCIIATFSWTVSFGLMRGWSPARHALGDWVVFAFFAVSLTVGIVWTIVALPDTRGLSLAQVQRLLAGEKLEEWQDGAVERAKPASQGEVTPKTR